MATYSTPFTAVPGSVYPAADHNTDVRDNVIWTHDNMLGGDVASIDNTDSPYTPGTDEGLLVCDTSGGSITITPAASASARAVLLKKTSGSNSVIFDPNGAELVDGASTYTLTSYNESAILIPDGTGWHVVTLPAAGSLVVGDLWRLSLSGSDLVMEYNTGTAAVPVWEVRAKLGTTGAFEAEGKIGGGATL